MTTSETSYTRFNPNGDEILLDKPSFSVVTANIPSEEERIQRAFIKWASQGRTEEQIWAVQNFLTGAFKEVK